MRSGPRSAVVVLGLLLPCAAVSYSLAQQAPASRPDGKVFTAQIRPLLTANCVSCHNAERQVGGVDLSGLNEPATAVRQRRLWSRIAALVEAGEMPPRGSKPLAPEARTRLVSWARNAAEFLDPNDPANRDPGPSVLRRLTRTEYNRTVKDLLGLDFDSGREVGMPDTENASGFDNLAAALTLSPSLLDKYMTAADKLLDRLAKDRRAGKAFFEVPDGMSGAAAAREVATRVMRRAYRRPARPVEIDRLIKLYERSAVGADHAAGIQAMLKPVLVSPYFLFRIEETSPASAPVRVNDHELAVRLAYFLWSTMPDEALFTLAEQGKLSDPAVLEAQVKRMLADPKARALTDGFGSQWLQLEKLDRARPSTEFFPAFTGRLKAAMRDETATFFDNLRREDRSVLDLLDADYTYVNEELAKHYGIPGVTGSGMQKVALQPEQHRGGLLGMGSVLALTSHTFRTSPTLRGKYILEVILGTPPPPPPPNAAGMLQEKRGKEATNFRELLAQHAGNPSCAGCHRKLDPLGFAMDNYDAVGGWRESSAERPLDTSGVLPTGEKFNGAAELKQILLKRKGEFVRNLAGQLLSYAQGRELQDSDEWTLRQVAAAAQADGYRFSSLILGIVKSVPFQYRRGAQNSAAKGASG